MTYRLTTKFNGFTTRIEYRASGMIDAFNRVAEKCPMIDLAEQITLRRL